MAVHRPLRGDEVVQENLTSGSRLGPVQIDECDPEIWAHHLAQLRRGLGHHDLQRGEHQSLEEVASALVPSDSPGTTFACRMRPSWPSATSPISDSTSHCSSTGMRRYCLAARSNQPTVARSKAPMAVTWSHRWTGPGSHLGLLLLVDVGG